MFIARLCGLPIDCRSTSYCASLAVMLVHAILRSAQVRACDDRVKCRNVGVPYKRACDLSSCALSYVALTILSH